MNPSRHNVSNNYLHYLLISVNNVDWRKGCSLVVLAIIFDKTLSLLFYCIYVTMNEPEPAECCQTSLV